MFTRQQAEEITLTIGQAFDLAYGRYFEPGSPASASEEPARELGQSDDNQLERQNDILRRRVVELSALIETRKLSAYLSTNGVILMFTFSAVSTYSNVDFDRRSRLCWI